MEQLVKLVKANNLFLQPVEKYTLLIDEQGAEHGALFFVEVKERSYKVMVPTPHHLGLLTDGPPTAQQLLLNKQAMLLK